MCFFVECVSLRKCLLSHLQTSPEHSIRCDTLVMFPSRPRQQEDAFVISDSSEDEAGGIHRYYSTVTYCEHVVVLVAVADVGVGRGMIVCSAVNS